MSSAAILPALLEWLAIAIGTVIGLLGLGAVLNRLSERRAAAEREARLEEELAELRREVRDHGERVAHLEGQLRRHG